MIELARIRPDPSQPRKNFDTDQQRELAASVRSLGILQPIVVRYLEKENIYQIVSGERRYHASHAAKLAEIPCWVQNPQADRILLQQIVENWQRSDLDPYDLADALAALRDAHSYSQKQLAEVTGKPESEISRHLALLKLDPNVQKATRKDTSGTFTRRHLNAIAQLPQEDQQEVMIAVRERNLTAVDTEHTVQEKKARLKGTKTRGAPPAHLRRFRTSLAMVTITSRKRQLSEDEILTALDEVRTQIEEHETDAS